MNKINLTKLDKNKLIELVNNSELYNIDDTLNGLELFEISNSFDINEIKYLLDSELIDLLVKKKIIVNSISYYFLLKIACILDNFNIAKILIAYNKIKNTEYLWVLNRCCSLNNTCAVEFLLSNINFSKDDISIQLGFLCIDGNEYLIKLLYNNFNAKLNSNLFLISCQYNYYNLSKWIYSELNFDLNELDTIMTNSIEIIDWIKEINQNINIIDPNSIIL